MHEKWFEVYEFVDNDIMNGTKTLETFVTYEEAEKYCDGDSEKFIDEWEIKQGGIPMRVF